MDNNDVVIREAKPEDEAAIVELWKELITYHFIRDKYFDCHEEASVAFAKFVGDNIASEKAVVVVAEREGKVIGFCQGAISAYPPVFRLKEFGMILDAVVTASCRRVGIGRQLIQQLKSWFAARGIRRMELRVAVRNPDGLHFWTEMGFQPVAETRFLDLE